MASVPGPSDGMSLMIQGTTRVHANPKCLVDECLLREAQRRPNRLDVDMPGTWTHSESRVGEPRRSPISQRASTAAASAKTL